MFEATLYSHEMLNLYIITKPTVINCDSHQSLNRKLLRINMNYTIRKNFLRKILNIYMTYKIGINIP